jgi:acyl CoA:acetate/3-ketoacid CoA transferase alpha subunit
MLFPKLEQSRSNNILYSTLMTVLCRRDLVAVSNDMGVDNYGLGKLIEQKQIRKIVASYVAENKSIPAHFNAGNVELELCPQGTLAEKIRAGGAGIPAFYTATGVGTVLETGGFPTMVDHDTMAHAVIKRSAPRESRVFNGRKYLMEEAITGDFALVKAWKADKHGNLKFRFTAQNFNPECAKAGKVTIAEVEEIVEEGELAPDEIHLPGIYVQRVVKGEVFEKRIHKRTVTPKRKLWGA